MIKSKMKEMEYVVYIDIREMVQSFLHRKRPLVRSVNRCEDIMKEILQKFVTKKYTAIRYRPMVNFGDNSNEFQKVNYLLS
jgi:hypothetical protein